MEQTRPVGAGSDDSAVDVAKQQASDVAGHATQAGRDVAQTAKAETQQVLQDAGQQARQVWDQTRSELTSQSSAQQQRLADGLGSVGRELREMADGGTYNGVASDLARQGADKADELSAWLKDREPGDVVDEIKQFARSKPGLFLAGAAVAGLVIGRMSRGLADDRRDTAQDTGEDPRVGASGDPSAYVRPAGMPHSGGATA